MIFFVLVKKEVQEMISSYKIFILPIIFIFFGIMQPVVLYLLPDILESTGTEEMVIELPPVIFADAICEYFSSILQLGAIVVVLMIMSAVARERASGTAALILSKPVSRASFIAAKFTTYSVVTAASFLLGTGACWYYTEKLIAPANDLGDLLIGMTLLLILLIFLVALVVFMSTLMKRQILAGISALVIFYLLQIPQIFGGIWARTMPYGLMDTVCALVKDGAEAFSPAVLPTMVMTAAFLIAAWQIFERQEL